VLTTERIRTLRDDGLTMREIARELDCSVGREQLHRVAR